MSLGCGCGNESKGFFCFLWWITLLLGIIAIIYWLWLVFGCQADAGTEVEIQEHFRKWGSLGSLWLAVIAFGVAALVAWHGYARAEKHRLKFGAGRMLGGLSL